MGAPERIENPKEEWNVEKRGVEGNGKILKKKGYKRQGLKAGRKDRSERGRGERKSREGFKNLSAILIGGTGQKPLCTALNCFSAWCGPRRRWF